MQDQVRSEPPPDGGLLIAWTFDTPTQAFAPAAVLMHRDGSSSATWATASWEIGKSTPTVAPGDRPPTEAAAFWHLLLGLTYLLPLASATADADFEPSPSLELLGFPIDFVNRLRDALVPGTSQLLVLLEDAEYPTVDTLVYRFGPSKQALSALTPAQLDIIKELYMD